MYSDQKAHQVSRSKNLDATTTVVFVYLGDRLPKYACASLELASRQSGMDVHLIANEAAIKRRRGNLPSVTAVEDFYDSARFEELADKITFSHSSRNGFWLKTFERLFVLDQFAAISGLSEVFHAELDQLLFRADLLVDELRSTGLQGVFLPFHTANRAVASILYWNSSLGFSEMLGSFNSLPPASNEMELIANSRNVAGCPIFPIPSAGSLHQLDEEVKAVTINGIADAAQLGQWVGGIDPRNVSLPRRPRNKFVDSYEPSLLSREQLEQISLRTEAETGRLLCSIPGKDNTPVYNLHLHSKIHHSLLKHDPNVPELINLSNSNSEVAFRGTRAVQVSYAVKLTIERIVLIFRRGAGWCRNPQNSNRVFFAKVRSWANRILRRRPSSAPFLSGDSFRAECDHVWEQGSKVDAADLEPNDLLFCESHLLPELRSKVLCGLDVPVTLILGNSDSNHSDELRGVSKHQFVTRIYAQNLMEPVPLVTALPIGLENRWLSNHGALRHFKSTQVVKPENRIQKILCSFALETNRVDRHAAFRALSRCREAVFPGKLSPKNYRRALSEYAYVACPPGNGLDTHRVWEALYLGCIPVVLDSEMTRQFRQLQLPIHIVSSYSELEKIDQNFLSVLSKQIAKTSSTRALWLEFWLEQMREVDRSRPGSKEATRY